MMDANMNDVTELAENDGKKQLHSLFDKVNIRKKLCIEIFSPQSYLRFQTELFNNRSVFYWGQCS